MFYRHCQNIITSNSFSAIRLNSFKYESRFLFTGIFEKIGVYLATNKAGSDNIKRIAWGVNYKLPSPVVTSVSSQSNQVTSMVEVVMGKQNGFYLFLFGQRKGRSKSTSIYNQSTVN